MCPELDIVVYAVVADSTSDASKAAREVFARAAAANLHLSMMEVPAAIVSAYLPAARIDSESVTCLRSVLMKPEHRDWLDRIMRLLETSATA
jgi:hypothetical protein